MKSKVTYFLTILLALLWISSCGVKRNNVISKKFHRTTTFFNYYYNAELVWKEGVQQINAAFRVPPEGFIPVWWAGTEEDSKSYGTNFDQAIEKCEIALQKHNQKDNKWMDELRFLIGRSWFYKRSYLLAIKNFEYVIKTYPDSKIIPDVYLWMVKTHYMDGNNTMAVKLLEEKIPGFELKKRQMGELALVRAQVYLDEENYEEVLRTLNANKKNIKGKTNKARVYYLLGQIYKQKGSFARAYENFRKVSRLNTDYELIFNAKLNMAKLMIGEHDETEESKKLYRYLKKMLRDEKNIDYRDRIYYEMAMLDIKTGDLPGAIEYLQYSVAANTNNQRQKALSYYKIGQLYFYDIKDFPMAQVYFDSASTAINKDAPEFREISMISSTLKEYIGYINTIQLQDSLLRLSSMTDDQLSSYVDEVIEDQKLKEDERQQRELDELNRLNDPNLFNAFGENKSKRGSGFYFDTPDLVSSGKIDFEQKWGRRKNEDNWRRKNKALQITSEDKSDKAEEEEFTLSKEDLEKYGSADKARMIKMVPRAPEEKAMSHQKIVEALYGLGQVYANKLQIQDSAIAVFKRLIRRYPDSEYSLKGRYALFQIYKDQGNEDLAAGMERDICGNYPDSRYCKYCRNEEVPTDTDEGFEEFISAYKALFETFGREEYQTCLEFSTFILKQYSQAEGLAEVYVIRGKCFAYLGKKDSLQTTYEYVKLNYPDSDVIPEVNRTLAHLKGVPEGRPVETLTPGPGSGPKTTKNPAYQGFTTSRKPHEKVYVVMLVQKTDLKSNELQLKINNFNKATYPEKRLNASIFLYKNLFHLPYISQFNDEKQALGYIKNLLQDDELAGLLDSEDEKIVFITPANFRSAYGKKRFEDYFIYYQDVVLPSVQ